MKIVKGKLTLPPRVVIYGTEGVGKSTLASQIPGTLFLDTEESTTELNVDRVLINDYRTLEAAIDELIKDQQGYKHVAIDTADWAERLVNDHLCRIEGKKSIEDFGYGKGYTKAGELMSKLLEKLDTLIGKGVAVTWIAHSKVVRVSPPDETDGFDRYELKLSKYSAPLLKEWARMVLFVNWQMSLVEGSDGKMKAQGGKERVIYTERTAAWDAKNRYGLPESITMDIAHLLPIYAGQVEEKPEEKPEPKAAPQKAPEKKKEPEVSLITEEQLNQVNALLSRAGAPALVESHLAASDELAVEDLNSFDAAALISALEALPGTGGYSPEAKAWLENETNSKAACKLLQRIGWLHEDEDMTDLPPARVAELCSNWSKFTAKALRGGGQ